MPAPRADGRSVDQLRPITFEAGVAAHATGSVLVSFGATKVICAAMIEPKVPTWMRQQNVPGGWLTAEYSMLPYSTLERKQRDSTRGKVEGRTIEIQRLIGRSLRAVLDLKKLGQNTLWIDCDVLQADGGTRTAAITGGWVALALAFRTMRQRGLIERDPLTDHVAAISCGLFKGTPVLDLDYAEDSNAEADANFVLTGTGGIVEVQGTAEKAPFSRAELDALMALAEAGIGRLVALQKDAVAA